MQELLHNGISYGLFLSQIGANKESRGHTEIARRIPQHTFQQYSGLSNVSASKDYHCFLFFFFKYVVNTITELVKISWARLRRTTFTLEIGRAHV